MIKLRIKGKAINIRETLVIKVTRYPLLAIENNYALLTNKELEGEIDVVCITTAKKISQSFVGVCVYNVPELDHLMEGDIVGESVLHAPLDATFSGTSLAVHAFEYVLKSQPHTGS